MQVFHDKNIKQQKNSLEEEKASLYIRVVSELCGKDHGYFEDSVYEPTSRSTLNPNLYTPQAPKPQTLNPRLA